MTRDELIAEAATEICTCIDGDPWNGECIPCGANLCPFGDALHCHHDGCPSAYFLKPEEDYWPDGISAQEAQEGSADCTAASMVARDVLLDYETAATLQVWAEAWAHYGRWRVTTGHGMRRAKPTFDPTHEDLLF